MFPRLVRALDSIFGMPFPYMAGWTQVPAHASSEEIDSSRLFLRLISNRRAADKLKYLAGSESLMGAFINDVTPETAAAQIRESWERSELG
jgi:UDPglucose--hexose-1-phosphate uridylyltransferase